MSLFQYLNNEALDDDYKQRARLAQMIRKNVDDNEIVLNQLTAPQKLNLYKSINYLNNTIDQTIYNYNEREGRTMVDIAPILYAYNNMALLLNLYKINTVDPSDKNKVYKSLDEIHKKLVIIHSLNIINDESANDIIETIMDELENRTFNTIMDVPEEFNLREPTKAEKNIKKIEELERKQEKRQVKDEVDMEEPEDEDDYEED